MWYLGATASSSGMDVALTQATAWVERHLSGRIGGFIRRGVYAETVAGYGGQRLMLSVTPIYRIQRMFDDTSTSAATEYCSTDFRIEDLNAGFVELRSNSGFAWDSILGWNVGTLRTISSFPVPNAIQRHWLLVYEAGWSLLGSSSTDRYATTSTGRTLPDEIERAVMLKAAEFWQGDGGGVTSYKVGPLALNYGSADEDEVCRLLAPYRRVDY